MRSHNIIAKAEEVTVKDPKTWALEVASLKAIQPNNHLETMLSKHSKRQIMQIDNKIFESYN
jgi:hypothetical protein